MAPLVDDSMPMPMPTLPKIVSLPNVSKLNSEFRNEICLCRRNRFTNLPLNRSIQALNFSFLINLTNLPIEILITYLSE